MKLHPVPPIDKKNPWLLAKKLDLWRADPTGKSHLLDKGVNFFVLALERLGAVPSYSCEGHAPYYSFNLVFVAPLALAARIADAHGGFDVCLCDLMHGIPVWSKTNQPEQVPVWTLRLGSQRIGRYSQARHDGELAFTAAAWNTALFRGKFHL